MINKKQALLYLNWVLVLITYILMFYCLKQEELNEDFSSFYASLLHFLQNKNPYGTLQAFFLVNPSKVAVNINPPFFLWFFRPLSSLNYTQASFLFASCSLFFGIIGSLICLTLTSSRHFFKHNRLMWIVLYLSLYATLMNTNFNQVAGLLFFLIMTGYYFFLQRKDGLAGLCWGIAIAIKLFPGLLFFYVLHERRYKAFFFMMGFTFIAICLPFYSHGIEIYQQFFHRIDTLFWYGNSWNASLYGFLFRLFNPKTLAEIKNIQHLYLSLFMACFIFYIYLLKALKTSTEDHGAFCLTLLVMLFLSPFGWMYYFSLLILPLTYCYQKLSQQHSKPGTWSFCFFLLNWPIINEPMSLVNLTILRTTLYSIYFYGLVLLLFLFHTASKIPTPPLQLKGTLDKAYFLPIKLSLTLSLAVVLITLLKRTIEILI